MSERDDLDAAVERQREAWKVPKARKSSASERGKRANAVSIESRRAKRVPVALAPIGKGKPE